MYDMHDKNKNGVLKFYNKNKWNKGITILANLCRWGQWWKLLSSKLRSVSVQGTTYIPSFLTLGIVPSMMEILWTWSWGWRCSVAKSFQTLCNPMDCNTPGSSILHYLLEFAQIDVHWVGDTIKPSILCCPLLLLPSILSSIRVFSSELALHIR